MKIETGELRVAWAVLIVLAYLAFPGSPPPGRLVLAGASLGFLPGVLLLASGRATARLAAEVEGLLATSMGRVFFVIALGLTLLIGIAVNMFVGLFLMGLAAEIMAVVLLLFPKTSLARLLPGVTIACGTTLILVVLADAIMSAPPVGAQLGTPKELEQWRGRYDSVKVNNFFRFRSRYEDTRRKPGVRRVVTLGDSFTEGHGIWSTDSTWPSQLERELSGGPDGKPTEVVNMARGGFTTGNEAEMMRRIGWQFDPDLVIIQWLDNDVYATYPNFRHGGARESPPLIPPRFNTGLIRNSAIVSLIERSVEEKINEPLSSLYTPQSKGWQELQAALKEIADSAAQRCVPAVLLTYPYVFPGTWTVANHPERKMMDMVADVARRDGYEVLDVTEVFASAGQPWEHWWVTPYDTHPNAAIQHLAAQAIARFIRERHLLPDNPDPSHRCKANGTPKPTRGAPDS